MWVGETQIILKQGDITEEAVDAIVNAANTSLLGGGGVDGAIHRKGGAKILEECKKIGGCKVGQAVITSGGNLLAKYVIHTVGPIWKGGCDKEEEKLYQAYYNSLDLAAKHSIKTIAFPSISTGAYRFPIEKAAKIAIKAIKDFVKKNQKIKQVRLILFSKKDFDVYKKVLEG